MSIYVSGSVAFDRIMDFPGKFSDHILPVVYGVPEQLWFVEKSHIPMHRQHNAENRCPAPSGTDDENWFVYLFELWQPEGDMLKTGNEGIYPAPFRRERTAFEESIAHQARE